jgi:chromosome segregation ATPase
MVLGSVAFGVSFCLNLVANRELSKAFLTGVITIPATYAGAVVIHKRRLYQEKLLRNSLQSQIQELEDYKEELNQYLLDALAEEQQVEASINTLQSELSYLRSQVSEGYSQRKSISWELVSFQEQKQQQFIELSSLQSQISAFENQIKELHQILATKAAEIEKSETELNSIQSKIYQAQSQIAERENDKHALEEELIKIQRQKYLLLEEGNKTRNSLNFFNLELIQLQAQIAKQQTEQQATNQDFLTLKEEKKKLEEELYHLRGTIEPPSIQLPVLPPQPISLPKEWTKFIKQLPEYEFLVLQALAEPDNPIKAIKRIAEENLTMPELLIDSINNCAMDTIGDRIIEPGSVSTPPVIAEEYLTMVKKVIDFYQS